MITVTQLLSELNKNGAVKQGRGEVLIHCPFHNDRSPSCAVSLGKKVAVGVFKCWSCGASGNYNALATKLGLKLFDSNNSPSHYYINNRKIDIYQPQSLDNLDLSTWDLQWKSYSPQFLSRFQAKKMWEPLIAEHFLFLPLTYLYNFYGYIRCRLSEETPGPKYLIQIEDKILYPFDLLIKHRVPVVVLVEGVADAIRLIKYKIPTMALFGTVLTSFQLELLKSMYVKDIILCMDGDESGYNAVYKRNGIGIKLHKAGFGLRVIFPPEGKDPDDMPMPYVRTIQKMIRDLNGYLLGEE